MIRSYSFGEAKHGRWLKGDGDSSKEANIKSTTIVIDALKELEILITPVVLDNLQSILDLAMLKVL